MNIQLLNEPPVVLIPNLSTLHFQQLIVIGRIQLSVWWVPLRRLHREVLGLRDRLTKSVVELGLAHDEFYFRN